MDFNFLKRFLTVHVEIGEPADCCLLVSGPDRSPSYTVILALFRPRPHHPSLILCFSPPILCHPIVRSAATTVAVTKSPSRAPGHRMCISIIFYFCRLFGSFGAWVGILNLGYEWNFY